jgi:hypothetical protein
MSEFVGGGRLGVRVAKAPEDSKIIIGRRRPKQKVRWRELVTWTTGATIEKVGGSG